ncbi:MAG TPA: NnrU family protein [Aurantimonas sp.]
MMPLLLGMIVFFGVHSLRIFAEDGPDRLIARLGESQFKLTYSALSLIGLLLIIFGYGQARADASLLWSPPAGLRHLAFLLVPAALILVVSAYAPTGHIKAAVRHPMVLGVALWALAHLLVNGTDADLVLFGGFLAWALVDYASALRRTATGATQATAEKGLRGDIIAVAIGLVLSGAFLYGLHGWLFGVPLLG